MENSFEDICSEDESSSEEEEEASEEDDDEDSSPEKVRELQKTLFGAEETKVEAISKARRCIMNLYCTQYDVISRVAKKCCNFRLKEFEEDADGAVKNGEKNQKLRGDWDVSWHDLGISADFLSKMEPY